MNFKNIIFFALSISVLVLSTSPAMAYEGSIPDPSLPWSILAALFASFFVAILLVAVALYAYTALAYSAIAKKTGTEPSWLAWIPIANIYLISKIAQQNPWPMWFLLVCWIPFLNIIPIIIIAVYVIIWQWKMFERIGRPGWWVLMNFIPFFGQIIYLVLLGIAAWQNPGTQNSQNPPLGTK